MADVRTLKPTTPSAKKYAQQRHQLTTEALRSSLREHGQHVPVYKLGGVTVDGRRRERLLQELGRRVTVVHLRNHKEAARVLWTLHPFHAWAEYGAGEERTLSHHAEFFGVSPADIAKVRRMLRKSNSDRGELGTWRANYRARYETAQRYLSRVRQGLEPLTLGGIEAALKLPPFTKGNRK